MPRGNRKENLSTRLAKMPRRGLVPPEEIPGSPEWALQRQDLLNIYDHACPCVKRVLMSTKIV